MPFLASLRAFLSGGDPAFRLAPGAFAEALKARPSPVLIDVRTAAEFHAGHIEGARNVDVASRDFDRKVSELGRGEPVLLYCLSSHRSAAALARMRNLGFTRVRHLAGGTTAWKAAGLPLKRQVQAHGRA